MIPPAKPWESGQGPLDPNKAHVIEERKDQALPDESMMSSSQASQYGHSYDGGSYGYGGYYGVMGPGMMGGYGGTYFGGMYPMGGPFMEIERQGQMLHFLGQRCVELFRMVSTLLESSASYISNLGMQSSGLKQAADAEHELSEDIDNLSSEKVSQFYDPAIHTYTKDVRKKALSSIRRWILRAIAFLVFYLMYFNLKRLLFRGKSMALKLEASW